MNPSMNNHDDFFFDVTELNRLSCSLQSETVNQPVHTSPKMTSPRFAEAVKADGRLPRRLKSHEMDEFLKKIYPHARTPQERMRECNIDLLRMANEIPCPEYAMPTAVGQDDLFSDLLDSSIYDESFNELNQSNEAPQGFERSPSSFPLSCYLPVAPEVGRACTTNYNYLRTDSDMESSPSAMGSFGDSSSNYTWFDYLTPLEFQTSGTYTDSSLSVGSGPSLGAMDSPPLPECQLSRNRCHQVSSSEHPEAAEPLVMVLNAKNMSAVAQRRRAKYTPAKRKEVHATRKRGACQECRRRKKKVNVGELPLMSAVEPDTVVEQGLSPFPPESDFVLFPEDMDYRLSPSQMNMNLSWTDNMPKLTPSHYNTPPSLSPRHQELAISPSCSTLTNSSEVQFGNVPQSLGIPDSSYTPCSFDPKPDGSISSNNSPEFSECAGRVGYVRSRYRGACGGLYGARRRPVCPYELDRHVEQCYRTLEDLTGLSEFNRNENPDRQHIVDHTAQRPHFPDRDEKGTSTYRSVARRKKILPRSFDVSVHLHSSSEA
ncbi:hypothetical protein GP486_000140 [Trichoglossum hirsutum]|uniref:Uncharacterized protein n=1 Tax=Trichoglossum hirsutum TaxID=265104 RepID=A0A9P8LIE0_9PEZI|nr:hypothetical protein GP486_000140 [Trichoglossum hirsutum]